METKRVLSTKRLYIEKQNPLFIILTIVPLILSVVTLVFGIIGPIGVFAALAIITMAASGCYFLPWAMLNYWKDRQSYTHSRSIKGVFVLNIIGIALMLGGFIINLIIPGIFAAFVSPAMIAYLIMLIMGLVFTGCNTRAHIEKMARKQREKAAKQIKALSTAKGNRNWVTTFVLCVLFGMFGAHRMYVGKKKYGITTLVLSLLGIGFIIFFIPWIVDFAKILCHIYKDKSGKVITRDKTWVPSLVLCVLFGMFGAHRMFVGKKTYGVLTLVLSLLGIGFIIFFIPWIVDFAKILCHSYKDKTGKVITDLR